jgi:predicted Fe-S protein YdhL (DUF1289 family)
MGSPCIDVCRYDEATGWCLGCGMSKPEKKAWKREKPLRQAIAAALPGRLAALAAAGRVTGKAAAKLGKKKRRREAERLAEEEAAAAAEARALTARAVQTGPGPGD